ncbi:hypothetical protein BDQ17DRAFT_1413704 [Cyathus striatus]|nr:hypothetical protein BDQ17DRAFT_1413704 [Cyathus striatus]
MQVANLREEVRQFQDTALPGSRTTLLLQTQINCSVPHAGAVPCGLGFGGDGMELILVRVAVAGQAGAVLSAAGEIESGGETAVDAYQPPWYSSLSTSDNSIIPGLKDKEGEQMFQVLMVVPPKGKIRGNQELQLTSAQSSLRIYDVRSMITHELLEEVARIFIGQDQYMAIRRGALATRVVVGRERECRVTFKLRSV